MRTAVLDVLYDVFRSHALLNQFPELILCGFYWPPCSLEMNPCIYFLWEYLNDCVLCTVLELQTETEIVAENI